MQDAQTILDFIIHGLGVDRADIILMGASLGTVVSVTLASNNPGLNMLVYFYHQVLMSPIESIKRVVEDSAGSLLASFASLFMGSNLFNSKSKASKVTSPILLMHGMKDSIAQLQHSYNLFGIQQITRYF